MMKKLLVVLALLIVASPAMAALELKVGEGVFDYENKFLTVDVQVAGWSGDATTKIGVIQGGMAIGGADAARFAPQQQGLEDPDFAGWFPNNLAGKTVEELVTVVAPATWALTPSPYSNGHPAGLDYFEKTSVANAMNDGNFALFGVVNENAGGINGDALAIDSVIMRFMFTWTGEEALSEVLVDLRDWTMVDGSLPVAQSAQNQGGANVPVTVANNGVNLIPEPATMGLLGLGLAGLIARRRRASK